MLDDGKARRRFEYFGRLCHRARVELRAGNDHLARHLRHHWRPPGHIGSTGLVGRRRRRRRELARLRAAARGHSVSAAGAGLELLWSEASWRPMVLAARPVPACSLRELRWRALRASVPVALVLAATSAPKRAR